MDPSTFVRMRFDKLQNEAQTRAQQRLREAARNKPPLSPGRYAVRSTPKELMSQLSQLSLAPAQKSVIARKPEPTAMPALTLVAPDHIWVFAIPPDGTGAGRADGIDAPPLSEQRALAHGALALSLLRELLRPRAGAEGAAAALSAGPEARTEQERLDLALEHLKRMEALLAKPSPAAAARVATAYGHVARSPGAASQARLGAEGAQAIDGTRRLELLCVAFSNLAAFYYKRGLPRPAIDYCLKAAEIERTLYDRVEFTTHLRTAAVLTALNCDADALSHCEQAWKTFLVSAHTVKPLPHAPGGADDGAGEIAVEDLPTEYVAAAAVICTNLAVALLRLHRHAEGLEVAVQAEQYAACALPPKHEHHLAAAACVRYARVFDEYSEMLRAELTMEHGPGRAEEPYSDFDGGFYDDGDIGDDGASASYPSLKGPAPQAGSVWR
jgi:tetratricopeptide (TPR) repeat protein